MQGFDTYSLATDGRFPLITGDSGLDSPDMPRDDDSDALQPAWAVQSMDDDAGRESFGIPGVIQ